MKNIVNLTGLGLVLLTVLQVSPSFASELNNFLETNQPKLNDSSSAQQTPPGLTPETFSIISPRFGVSFTTPGAGFDSFSSIEGFIPLSQTPGRNLTFLEGKLLISTSNSALGGNLLLGHRFRSHSGQSLLGGYISLDYRNTGDAVFNQIGLGLESLSDTWEFRTNAYLPLGNRNALVGATYPGAAFRGNILEIDRVQLFQQALTGVDAEVGTKLGAIGSGSLRGYAGLYYYAGQDIDRFVGLRARIVARPTDYVVAGLTLQSDPVFDTRLIFNVGISFPPNNSSRSRKNTVLARIDESPQRQSSIAIGNVASKDKIIAINPATGSAYTFQQVNLGLSNGNGTIESPFGTVQAALNVAKPNDIVYVQSGTNPGIPSFKIPDDVKVLSTAFTTFLPTQAGETRLPLSGSGVLPTVTGTVTLGNNTALSGFAIANSTGAGVEGSNIRNVRVENNTITNSSLQGIRLNNVTGTVEILNNTVDTTGTSYSGIETSNNSGAVDLMIAGNQVRNAQSTGDFAPLSDGDGIVSILEGTATGNVNIVNNTVSNNGRIGILLETLDSAQATSTISNNTATNNADSGILTYLEDSSRGNITIASNTVSSNQSGGIENYFLGSSQGSITISGNNATNNNDTGIFLGLYDNAQVSATISSNQVSGTVNSLSSTFIPTGIGVEADNTAQGNVSITNNIVTNNLYGITSNTYESASLKVSIVSNNVTGNLRDGIAITSSFPALDPAAGTSKTNISLQNNTVTGNNTTGQGFGDVSVASFNGNSDICVQAKNNIFGFVTLGDIPVAADPLLSSLAGTVRIEGGFPGSNMATLSSSSVPGVPGTIWSGTIASPGSCGFGN